MIFKDKEIERQIEELRVKNMDLMAQVGSMKARVLSYEATIAVNNQKLDQIMKTLDNLKLVNVVQNEKKLVKKKTTKKKAEA